MEQPQVMREEMEEADAAPSLQFWLPSYDAREHLGWICRFITAKGENILLTCCPMNTLLILDPPGSMIYPGMVRITVEGAEAEWDSILRRVGCGDEVFEIVAKDGSGAVLSRWEFSPLPH